MGETTGITWTDHTLNPVWGCAKISLGCDNCYAAAFAKRVGQKVWGTKTARRTFKDGHWNEPLKWQRQAMKDGRRHRVFCASMADVFDPNWPKGTRERLWELIKQTPALDWQVLTKRPENAAKMLPPDWGDGYPNVWLGVTAENQEYADKRIPVLLKTPALTRFVSYEPALELVNFEDYLYDGLDWLICGGESGPKCRPFDQRWAKSVILQCREHKVACFHKQMGELWARQNKAKSRHGADPAEWYRPYRVQQFPKSKVQGTPPAPTKPITAKRQGSLALL